MNIVMLLLGLVLSSTFVSALSATLVGYQMQSSAVNDQMRLLRKFLRERNVPSLVAFRVTKQAQHRIQQQVAIREDAVTILDTLSPSLLSELRESMYRSAVLTHPLFVLWESFTTSTFQGLTDMCDFQFCGPGDDVFLAGTRCFRVVFLMKGTLTYSQYPDSSVVAFTTNRPVEPDTWLCEAAIWCDWIHVGGAATTESSQLLVVEASRVVEVATKHRIISDVTREYCRQFHKCVIHARPPNPWPDDLSVPSTDCADIIHSMPAAVKTVIGLHVLDRVTPPSLSFGRRAFALDQLREEVIDGRSTVLFNTKRQAERVVAVTALRIDNGDLFLAQLAKWDGCSGSPVRVVVELPGSAQKAKEVPTETAERILRTKFWADPSFALVTGMERSVTYKESPLYRVKTKYLRAVLRLNLGHPLRIPAYRSKDAFPSTATSLETSLSEFLDSDHRVREVHAVKQDGKLIFYTWVSDNEFDRLRKVEAEALIVKWVHSLDMDASMFKDVREPTRGSDRSAV